jgi:hypothetical protein
VDVCGVYLGGDVCDVGDVAAVAGLIRRNIYGCQVFFEK